MVVLPLLICGALLTSRYGEVKKLQTAIDQVDAQEAELSRLQVTFRSPTEAERAQQEKAARVLRSVIHPEQDIPKFYGELAKVARRCDISDISFGADPAGAKEQRGSASASEDLPAGVACLSAKLSLRCQYQELALFLDGMSHLVPLVEVVSLEIKRGIPLILADAVVKTYYSKQGNHAQE
ncbi:MAG: hypothetical protein V1800_10875 [Candidatus Latescibacterota bacterium]